MPHDLNFDHKAEVVALAGHLNDLGTGGRAELRRMAITRGSPGCAAFWDLLRRAKLLDQIEDVEAWMRIAKLLAMLFPKGEVEPGYRLHEDGQSLGRLLCTGGASVWPPPGPEPRPFISEPKLARFLAQPASRQPETLERLIRALAQKRDTRGGIDCRSIAAFLLRPKHDYPAQALARDYYRALDKVRREEKSEDPDA